MKKIGAFLLGVGLLASVTVAADSNTATSVNIVGFQKITCSTGQWVLVSAAFQSVDGTVLKCANVISNQLPKGTSVITYDTTAQAYKSDSKSGFSVDGTWSDNITFSGGMGFWIYVPSEGLGVTTSSYDVVFAGQVPMSLIASNEVKNGFNLLGFPYTASVVFSNTSLYNNSVRGDSIVLWKNNTYQSYSKGGFGEAIWPDEAKALVITPDMGYWYYSSTNPFYNVEACPYTNSLSK